MRLIAMRLDQKIVRDDARELQKRIWDYDDRYGVGCATCTPEQKALYREWVRQLKALEDQLKEYRKKQIGG